MNNPVALLDVGNPVAESDDHLETYFLTTQLYRDIEAGKYNLVLGDKGSGKTAIFRILRNSSEHLEKTRGVVLVPVFNESGSSIFKRFLEVEEPSEAQLAAVWKVYIVAAVGNALLERTTIKGPERDALMRFLNQYDLVSDSGDLRGILGKVLKTLSINFKLKLRWFEFGLKKSAAKASKKLKGAKNDLALYDIAEPGLDLLKKFALAAGKTVWVIFDRLDEAFAGESDLEVPALRGLLRAYLDIQAVSPTVQLKLFARKDLYKRVTAEPFVNLGHVEAKSVRISWSDDDLFAMLLRRIRTNVGLIESLEGASGSTDEELFYIIFPRQVDVGEKRPNTWKWILSRIEDGNGSRSPRNLIDLIGKARGVQIRKNERSSGVARSVIIDGQSLKDGHSELSAARYTDYLLAETGKTAGFIKLFRGGHAEHHRPSLSKLLKKRGEALDELISELEYIGFLKKTGDSFKVPMLYRSGLEIRKGKSFTDED